MRVRIIMNPWSDQQRAKQHKDRIEQIGKKYHNDLDIVLTERPGHGKELARLAVEEGYDLVVAAGGDGTVHEVVNGLLWGNRAGAKLGVIPIGTGNDFAYALGIPLKDVEGAIDRLFTGKPHLVDLGRIEDSRGGYEYFDNNLGIGTDAVVVIRSEAITRLHGFLLYVVAVIQTIAFYYRTLHLEIAFDDELLNQETLLIAFGVGPRGGGGFFLTPDAIMNDDLIDTCTANPIGRLTMLRLVMQSLKGKHVNSRHVTMRKSKRIEVKSKEPMPIHIDGEMFAYPKDDVRHVIITSVPSMIEVIS